MDEIDLVDVMRCLYCGARAGQRCTTRGGKLTRSHGCRVAQWSAIVDYITATQVWAEAELS